MNNAMTMTVYFEHGREAEGERFTATVQAVSNL